MDETMAALAKPEHISWNGMVTRRMAVYGVPATARTDP